MSACIACDDLFDPYVCGECGPEAERCHECHIEVVHGRVGEAAGAGWATRYPAAMHREWATLPADSESEPPSPNPQPDDERYDAITE
jgi:hypothetical protein